MEKKKAHYDLKAVKQVVIRTGMDAFTRTAKDNSRMMGLSESEAVAVVLGLDSSMLFKSMTTHADSSVWQDVYHAPCPNKKVAYIKLTLRGGAVVIQFKEK